jgi:hypothetical protein
MVGFHRLDALQKLVLKALRDEIKGDLVEAGTWRGGTSILMRAALKACNVSDRTVWVADSFEGMPAPDTSKYPTDAGSTLHAIGELAVPLEEVKANFGRYELLDSQVRFLKGWFRETLPSAPISQIAVLCVDAGMYESTMNVLEHLYPKVSPGGFIILNDYALGGCRKAAEDYRSSHGITEKIESIDWSGAFWQRSAGPCPTPSSTMPSAKASNDRKRDRAGLRACCDAGLSR